MKRNRKGVVAVELALVSPILVTIGIAAGQIATMLHARTQGSSVAGTAVVLAAQGLDDDAILGLLEPLAAATHSTVAIVDEEDGATVVVDTEAKLFLTTNVRTRLPLVRPPVEEPVL